MNPPGWRCEICGACNHEAAFLAAVDTCRVCQRPRNVSWLYVDQLQLQLAIHAEVMLLDGEMRVPARVISIDSIRKRVTLLVMNNDASASTFDQRELDAAQVQQLLQAPADDDTTQFAQLRHMHVCPECKHCFRLAQDDAQKQDRDRALHIESLDTLQTELAEWRVRKREHGLAKEYEQVLECTRSIQQLMTQVLRERRQLEWLQDPACPFCGALSDKM